MIQNFFSSHSLKQKIIHPLAAVIAIVLSLMPALWVLSRYATKQQKIVQLKEDLQNLTTAKVQAEKLKALQQEIKKKIEKAPANYLDSTLSSLMLLSQEVKKWQGLTSDEKPTKAIEARIAFLEGEQNKITFSSSSSIVEEGLKVCEKKQKAPVEMGMEDLKKVLTIIEGVAIGSNTPAPYQPQLIIKEFHLSKKLIPVLKEKVYQVSMTLLEREKTSGHPL